MLLTEHKEVLDSLWNSFWPISRSQRLPAIAFIDALLLCKQLDEIQAEKDKLHVQGRPDKNPIFKAGQQDFRWSSFNHMYWTSLHHLFFRRGGILYFVHKTAKTRKFPLFARSAEAFIPNAAMLVTAINLISTLEIKSHEKRAAIVDYFFSKANMLKPNLPVEHKLKQRRLPRLTRTRLQSSKTVLFFFGSFLLGALAASLAYINWGKKTDPVSNNITTTAYPSKPEEKHIKNIPQQNERSKGEVTRVKLKKAPDKNVLLEEPVVSKAGNKRLPSAQPPGTAAGNKADMQQNKMRTELGQEREMEQTAGLYKIKSKAYFHNDPDERTRRNAFVNHWNNSYATLKALDEKNGFIYVVFQNHLKQTSKGWLLKKDLRPVTENN